MSTSFSSRIGARFRAFISALAVAAIAVGGVWICASDGSGCRGRARGRDLHQRPQVPAGVAETAGRKTDQDYGQEPGHTPEEFESYELGFEKIIAGNSSAIIRLKPLKPGTYMFFGEFHQDSALGHIVVE